MTYKIRPANKDDLTRLAEIERECIPMPWSLAAFESELEKAGSVILCAEDESGVIVGFVTASYVLDEVSVNNTAVTTSHRRRGAASLLLEALWERVKGFASFITLEVRESNIPAIALYGKHGYEKVGLRKNFYSEPKENAVLMTKKNII